MREELRVRPTRWSGAFSGFWQLREQELLELFISATQHPVVEPANVCVQGAFLQPTASRIITYNRTGIVDLTADSLPSRSNMQSKSEPVVIAYVADVLALHGRDESQVLFPLESWGLRGLENLRLEA